MSLPQLQGRSGGYVDRHRQGGRRLRAWPTRERLRALKRIIPRARVEEVLARTGHDRAHCPRLPAWFMVWFVIALGLFCRDCYRQVFRWLQPFRKGGTPRRTTLCEARKRLGVAPMRLLAQQVIRLQGTPDDAGRVLSRHADHGPGRLRRRSARYPGQRPGLRPSRQRPHPGGLSPGPRPGPVRDRQPCPLALADQAVLPRRGHHGAPPPAVLQPDMLLLWDRGFLSYQTVAEVRQRRAHLLARIKKNLIFEPIRVLDDGSYLSKLYRRRADRQKDRDGILVRIIEYTFDDPGRPGSGEPHRLLTTLLDEALDPAEA